jgi:hypothetical protein
MSYPTSPLPRLLSQLRGLVSIADTEVNRRDLNCPRHSEVQLELDFQQRKKTNSKWTARLNSVGFGA